MLLHIPQARIRWSGEGTGGPVFQLLLITKDPAVSSIQAMILVRKRPRLTRGDLPGFDLENLFPGGAISPTGKNE